MTTLSPQNAGEEPIFSIVIPCYNEPPQLLNELYRRLSQTVESWRHDYEVIVVDDGSSDEVWETLSTLHAKNQRWKAVRLSRNFGHQAAISAGLNYAKGQAIMVMDADLQDPPEVLPQFIEMWRDGYDVVYGVRRNRKEGWLRRTSYRLFYRLLCQFSRTPIPLDSGDFCLMDKRVVGLINSMPEKNRFVRGLRAWVGFDQCAVHYERDTRFGGDPKYTLNQLIQLSVDGMLSFSIVPLRLVTVVGFVVSCLAFMGVVFTFVQRIFPAAFSELGLGPVPGYATIVISVLFIGGVQLLSLGIIGEYIGRVYDEAKGRPLWIADKAKGLNASQVLDDGHTASAQQ